MSVLRTTRQFGTICFVIWLREKFVAIPFLSYSPLQGTYFVVVATQRTARSSPSLWRVQNWDLRLCPWRVWYVQRLPLFPGLPVFRFPLPTHLLSVSDSLAVPALWPSCHAVLFSRVWAVVPCHPSAVSITPEGLFLHPVPMITPPGLLCST